MAADKPIREMDTIMIRVPDGMKNRVAERARANGRSMGSEVLSILEAAMDEAGSTRIRELEALIKALDEELELLDRRVQDLKARREAASHELMRRTMVNKVRARKKTGGPE